MFYYYKYSQILYEGDQVSLFGLTTYNSTNDSWEISKPLFLSKEGIGKYLADLDKETLSNWSGLIIRGTISASLLIGAITLSYYGLKQIK